MNGAVTLLTGVSGCGKDYIVNRLMKGIENSAIMFSYYRFGRLIHDYMRSFNQSMYSEPSSLQGERPDVLMEAAKHSIDFVQKGQKPALVNTHIAYRQGSSLVISPEVYSSLNRVNIVFLRMNPEQISTNRKLDKKRRCNEEESVSRIQFDQDCESSLMFHLSKYLRCSLYEIDNDRENENTVSESVDLLASIVLGKHDA